MIKIILLLVIFSFTEHANASQPLVPTTAKLRQVIEAHYRAIEDNQLNRAMTYYHNLSPDKTQVRVNIELGLTQFLLKTTTLKFCYDGRKGPYAVAKAKHKFLMISGIKFIVQNTNVTYQLRKERGNWKIWTKRESPSSSTTMSNCDRGGNTLWVTL